MATIRKRGGKWQVQIRRQGYRATSRTFSSKNDALTIRWTIALRGSVMVLRVYDIA